MGAPDSNERLSRFPWQVPKGAPPQKRNTLSFPMRIHYIQPPPKIVRPTLSFVPIWEKLPYCLSLIPRCPVGPLAH